MASTRTCLVLALGGFLVASPSFALQTWGSVEREEAAPPPHGPSRPDAPLPPEGPYAPGEPEPDAAKQPKQEPEPARLDDRALPPIDADEKRRLPDYDGRDEPTTAGDVALWVPRVVLAPLYFVSEYVVRRPLGWVVTVAERKHLPAILVDFFTFGPERNAGVVPTGLIDFGLRPSVGLYFFWNDVFADDNDIRVRAATGGLDWWRLRVLDRYHRTAHDRYYVRGELSIRPDHIFNGFEPGSISEEHRFRMDELQAGVGYEADLWHSSGIETFVGVRSVEFDAGTGCCSDPSLAQGVSAMRFEAPPGLAGYDVVEQRIAGRLDTRHPRMLAAPRPGIEWFAPPGTGLKLELRGAHAAALGEREVLAGQSERVHWISYGATAGAFFDPSESQRVLGLELIVDFADPLGNAEVPFTEQVRLGGDRPMRGFLAGRLVNRSAAVGLFTYTWPVWVWLDGVIHYAVGNTFGEHLEDFELDLLRSSFGIGLRAADKRDHAFELLIATGTETFRDGGRPEEFRFVFGGSSGF